MVSFRLDSLLFQNPMASQFVLRSVGPAEDLLGRPALGCLCGTLARTEEPNSWCVFWDVERSTINSFAKRHVVFRCNSKSRVDFWLPWFSWLKIITRGILRYRRHKDTIPIFSSCSVDGQNSQVYRQLLWGWAWTPCSLWLWVRGHHWLLPEVAMDAVYFDSPCMAFCPLLWPLLFESEYWVGQQIPPPCPHSRWHQVCACTPTDSLRLVMHRQRERGKDSALWQNYRLWCAGTSWHSMLLLHSEHPSQGHGGYSLQWIK